MDERVYEDFLRESRECLTRLEHMLLDGSGRAPAAPGEIDALDGVRTVRHACGFLGLPTLGEFAHEIERAVDAVRNNDQAADDDLLLIAEGVENLLEAMQGLVKETDQSEAPPIRGDLLDRIRQVSRNRPTLEPGGDNDPAAADDPTVANDGELQLLLEWAADTEAFTDAGVRVSLRQSRSGPPSTTGDAKREPIASPDVAEPIPAITTQSLAAVFDVLAEILDLHRRMLALVESSSDSGLSSSIDRLDLVVKDTRQRLDPESAHLSTLIPEGDPGELAGRSMTDESKANAADPPDLAPTEASSQLRVLVVDDSLFYRELVLAALETNADCTGCESAHDAMAKTEECGFDLMIIDLAMPIIDGCELAEWIRNRDETASIPLIALVDRDDDNGPSRAVQAGFDRCLRKLNVHELSKTIEELIPASEPADASDESTNGATRAAA